MPSTLPACDTARLGKKFKGTIQFLLCFWYMRESFASISRTNSISVIVLNFSLELIGQGTFRFPLVFMVFTLFIFTQMDFLISRGKFTKLSTI